MTKSERFSIGFVKVAKDDSEIFLSVTPGFEHGPGIQRDGLTFPRMSDPHSIDYVCENRKIEKTNGLKATTNPFIQRAGTWSLYKHLKEFNDRMRDKWLITGVLSCGDLTMNQWHVAYIRKSYIPNHDKLCGLLTDLDPQEALASRIYRCIVKWKSEVALQINEKYCALNLTFHSLSVGRWYVLIDENEKSNEYHDKFKKLKNSDYDSRTKDISQLIDFAISGKPVVEKQEELSLSCAIDKFEDIRHIFNLPTVTAKGSYDGEDVDKINIGEYQLFNNLNERRAALSSAVIINLNIDNRVIAEWNDLEKILIENHFKKVADSPNKRGQFRRYEDNTTQPKVEIFFPHNVYPFGVLGLQSKSESLIGLSSGGLSGSVGNTLEGITRIMYDFFGCDDALVLDEGFDTFQIVNPINLDGKHKYSNDDILKKVLFFTKELTDTDHNKSLDKEDKDFVSKEYRFAGGMKKLPLNEPLMKEIDEDFVKYFKDGSSEYIDDVMLVKPLRTQMRSVIIFAKKIN